MKANHTIPVKQNKKLLRADKSVFKGLDTYINLAYLKKQK